MPVYLWKQYSGMWPLQAQMQAVGENNWPGVISYSLYSWGDNSNGSLALNDTISRSSPTQVGSPVFSNEWASFSAGIGPVLGIKTDGTLWAWGYNTFGELGQNNVVFRSSPVQVGALTNWSKVKCTYNSVITIKTDGTLWAWGRNQSGELGNNTVENKSSPIQIGSLTTWSDIAGGDYFVLATRTDGTLWAWGNNSVGSLGLSLNELAQKSSPTQVGALTTWSKVACGDNSGYAITTTGALWSWGSNGKGELGQNNNTSRSSPVQVGALTTWSKLTAGNEHALALDTSNKLISFGSGEFGQNGQNASGVNYSSPTQIGTAADWTLIGTTSAASFAINSSKQLYSWGYYVGGVLGQNDAINRSSPVQISGTWNLIGSNWDYYQFAQSVITKT